MEVVSVSGDGPLILGGGKPSCARIVRYSDLFSVYLEPSIPLCAHLVNLPG